MTTSQFIKMLQEADPSGEAHIRMEGGIPLFAELKPGYWDGPYEYIDEDDNYLKIPKVTYLPEGYYNYVFNKGSGNEVTVNFESLENSDTFWQSELEGISNVKWSESGTNLLAELNMNSSNMFGDMFLDVRYDCYVPGKDWENNQTLDMTTQEIVFYVRAADNFTSNTDEPLYLEAYAKDSPNWRIEYSQPVTLDSVL